MIDLLVSILWFHLSFSGSHCCCCCFFRLFLLPLYSVVFLSLSDHCASVPSNSDSLCHLFSLFCYCFFCLLLLCLWPVVLLHLCGWTAFYYKHFYFILCLCSFFCVCSHSFSSSPSLSLLLHSLSVFAFASAVLLLFLSQQVSLHGPMACSCKLWSRATGCSWMN